MIPRGKLDITWRTLSGALLRSLCSSPAVARLRYQIEQAWDRARPVLVCQSVRSGLDLLLSAKDWPPGSEILMSAVTIPDMARIVREHGLVPVSVDVNPQSLAPDIEQLQARITPRTRAILIAHLFGCRLDLSELAQVAAHRGLALWEDVAQGFAADQHPGDERADVSFFSFGTIKAQTALGGSVVRFRDPDLAARCREWHGQWPMQSPHRMRKKLLRAMGLQLLSRHMPFTAVSTLAAWSRRDLDVWLSQSVRGFEAATFFQQLRKQPCGPLLELLHCRLASPDLRWMARKTELAELYCQLLTPGVQLGSAAAFPARWVLPIVSRDRDRLQILLRQRGFDATTRASQLRVIPAPVNSPDGSAPQAEAWVSRMLFLPLHPALRPAHIAEIATTINEFEAGE